MLSSYAVSNLSFIGEALDEASQETIESYGIGNGNSLEMVIKAIGGSKCLKPLPGHIEVTDEPCCILYYADPIVKQAKMPCGCVVGEYNEYPDDRDTYLFCLNKHQKQ